jgi:hypothetical protein
MGIRLQAYDIDRSFVVESPGRAQRRLMNSKGQPQLGEKAWLLGLAAFEHLRTIDGRTVTNNDLREWVPKTEPELNEFFMALDEKAEAGKVSFVKPGTGEAVHDRGFWRDGDWPWKVEALGRFMLDLPNADIADVVDIYGAHFLVAALFRLDDAAIAAFVDDDEGMAACLLEAAWFVETVQSAERIGSVASTRMRALDSRRASDRAKQQHAVHPKRAARDFAFECWKAWQAAPTQYANATDFARAMLDKFPDTLTSEVVVTRWVRAWRKAAKK